MKSHKIKLLAATIIAGAAMPAQAQFAFPSVELRGVGASAVADINVKVMNCIGDNNDLGLNTGVTQNIVEADFTPTTPSLSNPTLTCSVDDVNGNIYNASTPSNFEGLYVSTGSGFGRQSWREFTNQFTGAAGSINPFGSWTNVQYAFSEAPASLSDLTDYNTDSDGAGVDISAAANAGPAIQLPLYVIPIAFAYNDQYGDNNGTPLNFRVKSPQQTNGVDAGGLRLDKTAYCGIWNGTLTNWNDASLTTLNGGQKLRALADPEARWDSEGVPIRLVGRADRSGTTDLFTRALAAQCSGSKYTKAAESLPYDNTSTINITPLRSDSHYFPGSTSSRFAGTVQSLNGYVYDRANDKFCFWNEVSGGVCPGSPAAIPAGAQTGSFTVADGSSSVEEAIRLNTGNLALASSTAGITLNGKFGYIGADFVAPSAGRSLFAAALKESASTKYLMPASKNASLAFGAVLPPQTTLKSGAWDVLDSRVVYKDLTNTAAGTEPVNRANPLHWVNVLYPPSGPTLADPTVGYPVTGASNLLTYTCFADAAKRSGMANFLGYTIGKVTKKNAIGGTPASIKLSANTFKGVGTTALGVLTQSNIALPASGWLLAYNETFLKKSTKTSQGQILGNLNLWIQSKQPAKATDIDQFPDDAVDSNPGCAGLPGA